MTHGRLWPAHPKPLPDELLSSWIVRIAEANAIKVQTMSRMLYGDQRTPWNRDIDRFAPKWLLREICRHTNVNYWTAYRMTLSTYRNLLYSRRRLAGQLHWVLPNLSYGTSRRGFGMQFCPTCLAQDTVPYFRKQWRLALSTYCPIHQTMLYDACQVCGAPICYFRRDFGRELKDAPDIGHCSFCGFDFRQANRRAPIMPDAEAHAKFDAMLRSLVNTKPIIYSTEYGFFTVLHQFCQVMCMRQNAGRLQAFVSDQTGLCNGAINLASRSIENLRIDDRHQLLIMALWLLVDLEPRLARAWQKKVVRYNLLVKDFPERPKWYSDVVGKFSNWRRGGFSSPQ